MRPKPRGPHQWITTVELVSAPGQFFNRRGRKRKARRGVPSKRERGAPLARSPSPSWAGPARIPGRDPLTSPRANSTLTLSLQKSFRSVPFCSYLGSSVLSPVMCWPLVSLPPSLSIQVYGGAVGVVSSPSCRCVDKRVDYASITTVYIQDTCE